MMARNRSVWSTTRRRAKRKSTFSGVVVEQTGWIAHVGEVEVFEIHQTPEFRATKSLNSLSEQLFPQKVEALQPSYAASELHSKLGEVSRYFKRKTGAVLNDDSAVRLLADLHESKFIDRGRPRTL